MEQDIAAQVVGLGGATDFSIWKLFLRADWVVKSVIILLIACSIFSWALIFDKFGYLKILTIQSRTLKKNFGKQNLQRALTIVCLSNLKIQQF